MRIKTLLLIPVLASSFSCSQQTQQQKVAAQQASQSRQNGAPAVQIEVNPIVKISEPLHFQWRITNASNKPIYIYSTFLQSNATVLELSVDDKPRMLELRFTLLEPLPFFVNNFPDAKFMEIGAHETREGQFTSTHPLREPKSFAAMSQPLNIGSVRAGTWQLRVLMAYGQEVESVKRALANWGTSKDDPHPINPIVRWQKVAYSQPVSVVFQE